MDLSVHKHRVAGNVEYFIRSSFAPNSKVLWLCIDTLKEDDLLPAGGQRVCVGTELPGSSGSCLSDNRTQAVRMWVSNLGVYPIPEDAKESIFLDILIVSGLSEVLLTSLYGELTFGMLVSFSQGKVHKKDHLFNTDTLKDLMN